MGPPGSSSVSRSSVWWSRDRWGAIAWVAVGLLIAVPMVRVLWLGARWFRRDDTRYAVAAVTLAATVAAGAVLTAALR